MTATDLFLDLYTRDLLTSNIIKRRRIFLWLLLLVAAPLSAAPSSKEMLFKSFNDAKGTAATAIQGGMLIGTTLPNNEVWLDEQLIKLTKDGSFIIAFARDAKRAVLKIKSETGLTEQQVINIEQREYKVERVDGLPPSKVNPVGEKVLNRIRKESLLVKSARSRNDQREDFTKGFIWPAKGRISGVYGSQRVLNGIPKRPHFGIDIAAPEGSDVIAPAAGIVTLAEADLYYSGGTIIIDHGFGLSSTFLHLSKVHVKPGQRVEQAELIAKIGSTGRATGHISQQGIRMNRFL